MIKKWAKWIAFVIFFLGLAMYIGGEIPHWLMSNTIFTVTYFMFEIGMLVLALLG